MVGRPSRREGTGRCPCGRRKGCGRTFCSMTVPVKTGGFSPPALSRLSISLRIGTLTAAGHHVLPTSHHTHPTRSAQPDVSIGVLFWRESVALSPLGWGAQSPTRLPALPGRTFPQQSVRDVLLFCRLRVPNSALEK